MFLDSPRCSASPAQQQHLEATEVYEGLKYNLFKLFIYTITVSVLPRRLLCFSWPLRDETRPHAGGAHWTYGGAHSQPHDNETAIDQQQAARRACERSWVRAAAVSTDKADALAQGARVGQQDDSHRAARPLPRHAGAA